MGIRLSTEDGTPTYKQTAGYGAAAPGGQQVNGYAGHYARAQNLAAAKQPEWNGQVGGYAGHYARALGQSTADTSPAPARSIRSATYSDGGGASEIARQAQYANRERQLLQGLPSRTSDYSRDLALRNATVGLADPNGPNMTVGQRQAALAARQQVLGRLDSRFAGEDQNYTNAYTALTGRQDAGVQSDRDRQMQLDVQGSRNQGALEVTGLQGENAQAVAGIQGQSAYDVADLQGRDAYARQRVASDPALLQAQAMYGNSGGTPGLAQQELDLRAAEARTQADQRKDALTKQREADALKRIAPLFNGDEGIAAEVLRRMSPDQLGVAGPDLTSIVASIAPSVLPGSYESGARQWMPGVSDYAQPGSLRPKSKTSGKYPWYTDLNFFTDAEAGDLRYEDPMGSSVSIRRALVSPDLYQSMLGQ